MRLTLSVIATSLLLLSILGKRISYYEILGVGKKATASEIRRAFRLRSLEFHPDKNPTHKEWANKRFVEVTKAYEVLKDPETRKAYDMGK